MGYFDNDDIKNWVTSTNAAAAQQNQINAQANLQKQYMTGLQDIIKTMQDAQTKANTANDVRYKGVLSSLETAGQAKMAGVDQQEQQALAKNTQNMTSSGLSNTTMAGAGGAGARQVASGMEGQRQQIQGDVAAQKAGVMERKTESGPDLSMFASLIQGMGASGAGTGMKTPSSSWAVDPTAWQNKAAAAGWTSR